MNLNILYHSHILVIRIIEYKFIEKTERGGGLGAMTTPFVELKWSLECMENLYLYKC